MGAIARKIRVIVNPGARRGGEAGLLPLIREEFEGLDLDIRVPTSYEETVEAASSAAADGVTDLVVAGGDGTINVAVNAIAGTDVRLGIIASGTANDLATHLGLPGDARKACRLIRAGQARRIDVLDCNGKLFATAGGMGVVSSVAVSVNRFKASAGAARALCRALGSLVYVFWSFALLLLGRHLEQEVHVACDGQSIGSFRAIALFINNQPTIGKTVMPCPDARPDDGALAGMVMTRRSRLGSVLTVVLMSLRGAHRRRKDVLGLSAREITVRSDRKRVFIGDGEVLAHTRTLQFSVHPAALRVLA